jgi:hypothetical protein
MEGEVDLNKEVMKYTLEAINFIDVFERLEVNFNTDGSVKDEGFLDNSILINCIKELGYYKQTVLPELYRLEDYFVESGCGDNADPHFIEKLELCLSKLEFFINKNNIKLPNDPR